MVRSKLPPKCTFIDYFSAEVTSHCFPLQEGKYHLKRCIDSGLWVPDSGEGVMKMNRDNGTS